MTQAQIKWLDGHLLKLDKIAYKYGKTINLSDSDWAEIVDYAQKITDHAGAVKAEVRKLVLDRLERYELEARCNG